MSRETYRQALLHGERVGEAWMLVPPRTMQIRPGGIREGRRTGGSLEFRDYRDYEPGDDLRHLDWSVFARSDRLIVRQFHEEVSPFVDLILDGSRSMALADSRKAEVAIAITAMFATAARNSSFPHALAVARDRVVKPPTATAKPSQWLDLDFDYTGDASAAILRAAPLLRPLSVRFVVSDLLWAVDPAPLIEALAHGAAALVFVEVFAAADERPSFSGEYRLVDSETGEIEDITFDAAASATYRDALTRHRELWDRAARESGAAIVRCVAEDLGENLMFDELAALNIMRPA